jgi:acetyl-CoA carboxylase carboxyl transferase subunit alpha|tara:strand:- start:491 stop:1444 length:954 start_codon:yes stop_codon:yes gene_type:complete
MAYTYLEFEKPISELENKIESLRDNKGNDESVHQEISTLSDKIENLTKEIYGGLSIWQKVQVARHPHRPHFSDYIENIFTDFDELHGDRLFGDDQAIIGGLAKFKGNPVVIIGHEKGKSTEDKISRNFGMSQPEGYRKASRLMKLAEDFSLPIITFIDTPGAYPGIESEERGMSEAIAKNLSIMSGLKVPIIVIITGEGGSGGALAIGVGDHISMLKYSIYSVASPEACASIVWRDNSKAQEAAEAMKLDAENLLDFGLIDNIIDEPLGGAHRDTKKASSLIAQEIDDNLKRLKEINIDELVEKRYQKIMSYGSIQK